LQAQRPLDCYFRLFTLLMNVAVGGIEDAKKQIFQ